MIESKAAQRYATAFLQIAVEENKVEKLFSDIETLEKLLNTSNDFKLFLKSPIINTEKKKKIMLDLFENKVDPITIKFLLLLTTKNREAIVPAIINSFKSLLDERRGIVNADISAVVAFSNEQKEKVTKRLEGLTKKKVRTHFKIDPTLIGGFKIQINDTVYDGSILNQFDILKQHFNT
ncbi:MAG: ATP synthase F1 subunit delta [Bacteroidota bacterium]|nr:ATP synthase F1 subunit delta [Bacteroidota bacterium]